MSGKGSTPRPIPDRERYEANWAAIDWGARDGVQDVHERSQAHGDTHGPRPLGGAQKAVPMNRTHTVGRVATMRAPACIDWSQAPEWAMYYAKDRYYPAWECISRASWHEALPSHTTTSPYGEWCCRGGKYAYAPEFGAPDDWGLVQRP